jgi:Zn-dependent protease
MFMRSIKLGRLAGFDIELNVSFLILLLLVVVFQGLAAGLALAVLVFGSVVLHELGHAVTARKLGVPISGIELHFFGGVAKMMGAPRSARDEILIAAAGPAVSFALGLSAFVLATLAPLSWLSTLAAVNLILGGFNLLPALPMDGGRIFRAALSHKMGRLKATQLAVKVTYGAAIALGGLALFSGLWHLLAIAVVLWLMASQEKRTAGLWSYEDERPRVEVLQNDGRSAGWFTADGRPTANRPAASQQPGPFGRSGLRFGAPFGFGRKTVSRHPATADPDADFEPHPSAGPGGSQRTVHRLPNGGWVVIEHRRL